MNWIDITILVILIYNIAVGYTNGLIRSIFGLLALIGAYLIAPLGKPIAFAIISLFLHWDKIILEPMAMALSWIVLYIAISLTGTLIWYSVKKTKLKTVDKLGGLALGLFISVVIINVPLILIDTFPVTRNIPQIKQDVKKSQLLPVMKPSRAIVEFTFKGMLNYWKIWMEKPKAPAANNKGKK